MMFFQRGLSANRWGSLWWSVKAWVHLSCKCPLGQQNYLKSCGLSSTPSLFYLVNNLDPTEHHWSQDPVDQGHLRIYEGLHITGFLRPVHYLYHIHKSKCKELLPSLREGNTVLHSSSCLLPLPHPYRHLISPVKTMLSIGFHLPLADTSLRFFHESSPEWPPATLPALTSL